MDVSRRGSIRNRGVNHLISYLQLRSNEPNWRDNNLRWDAKSKHIAITAKGVHSRDGAVYHDYTIQFSLDDVSALIEIVGHLATKTDAVALRDHLVTQIPALVKLLACATSITPAPMPPPVPKKSTSRWPKSDA